MDFHIPATPQRTIEALSSVCRALRAWKFYPVGHPARKKSIEQAYSVILAVLDGHDLSLFCVQSGFTLSDNQLLKDGSRLSATLLYELFIRRVRKITFLGDLRQEDLFELIRIVALPPDAVQQAGGMDKLMAERGIRTIWVNEFDLSAIREKRRGVEAAGVVPKGMDELEEDAGGEAPQALEPEISATSVLGPEEELQSLLARLAAERGDEIYLFLLRRAIGCAERLRLRHDLPPLLPLVELLAAHAADDNRGPSLAECARFGLEQLAAADDLLQFIFDRVVASDGVSNDALHALFAAGGSTAIGLALDKMATSDSRAVRRALAILLVRAGEPAVPAIQGMMGDQRWFVIRNLAAILGDIGSSGALDGLQKCLRHGDIRVGKEAIRSLAKIGGRDAEAALIAVLRDSNPQLLSQVIASLGGMKSNMALPELMQILCREDLFLKNLSLKMEVLTAIAMIGDPSVAERLAEIIRSRSLIARGRRLRLKIAIADCLGKLADQQALPVLLKLAAASGELGLACSAAVESILRTGGGKHAAA